MAFFSGLKAAYDSIGSEITKTFDSSGSREGGTSPEGQAEQPEAGDTSSLSLSPESTPSGPDKVRHAGRGGGGGEKNWALR